jgi:hypothetical protein
MNTMKIISLILALLFTMLTFTACGSASYETPVKNYFDAIENENAEKFYRATYDPFFIEYTLEKQDLDDDETDELEGHKLIPIGSRNDLTSEAHKLFSALRDADRMSASVIYGHLPPQDGIGLALYNRMLRAAAHTVKHI